MDQNEKKTFKPEIIKHLTKPTLKLISDVPVYVKITDKIVEGGMLTVKAGATPRTAPASLNVVNVETGEVCRLTPGATVIRDIQDGYPKHAYVNKCFMIIKRKKKGDGDRLYSTYEIAEIAEPK